eukprot:NODE_287_length_10726_cov_0.240614.p8 type:complete len:104 gc:universal NODE_287_length_10726_cov_0.240614:8728-8417(-)
MEKRPIWCKNFMQCMRITICEAKEAREIAKYILVKVYSLCSSNKSYSLVSNCFLILSISSYFLNRSSTLFSMRGLWRKANLTSLTFNLDLWDLCPLTNTSTIH